MTAGAIPPNPAASILQSPAQQQEHARALDADGEDRAAADMRARQAEANPDIDTTDETMRTNVDGGGGGSQGRAFRGDQDQPADQQPGVSQDETGQLHVDLEA
jgi:hypothetical protein